MKPGDRVEHVGGSGAAGIATVLEIDGDFVRIEYEYGGGKCERWVADWRLVPAKEARK